MQAVGVLQGHHGNPVFVTTIVGDPVASRRVGVGPYADRWDIGSGDLGAVVGVDRGDGTHTLAVEGAVGELPERTAHGDGKFRLPVVASLPGKDERFQPFGELSVVAEVEDLMERTGWRLGDIVLVLLEQCPDAGAYFVAGEFSLHGVDIPTNTTPTSRQFVGNRHKAWMRAPGADKCSNLSRGHPRPTITLLRLHVPRPVVL